MAKIERSEITQKAIKDLRLNPAFEKMPTEASDKIVLTYPLNEKVVKIVRGSEKTTTGSSTVYTTPSNKDFYLTGCYLQNNSNATADNTDIRLTCVIDGGTQFLIQFKKITLTAFNNMLNREFSVPIKLDRNSTIVLSSAFTVGSSTTSAGITGFEVEK